MPPAARARSWRALMAQRRVPLALVAAAVLVAGLAPAAVASLADRRADEDARVAVAALDAAQRGLRVTTVASDDERAQRAAAAALTDRLDDVAVVATRMTPALQARAADEPEAPARPVLLAYVADWTQRVDLVDGRAPAGDDEVVAPAASGLRTGHRLAVGSAGVVVRVVGTWRPRDPHDALWFADPGLATGTLSDRRDAIGPLLAADATAVDRAAERPLVRWTVVPTAQRLTAAGLARLADSLDALPDALERAAVFVQGATVEAAGGPNLRAVAHRALAARHRADAATAVGLGASALGLVAAAAGFEACTRREREQLLARGARRARIGLREAPGVLAVAALAGALAGALDRTLGTTVLGGAGLPTAGAAALGAAAPLLALRRPLPVDVRPAARPAPAFAAVLAAGTGLAAWRLVRTAGAPDLPALAATPLLLACAGALVGFVAHQVGVRRLGALPALAALAAGAATLAVRADGATLHAAWTAATAGALAAGAVASAAHATARRRPTGHARPGARRAPSRDSAWRLTGVLLVACGAGAGVALATASLVVGIGAAP